MSATGTHVLIGRLRAADGARPEAFDAGIAAVLYVLLTFAVTTAGELEHSNGRLIGAAVNVVLVAPLAWRRRAPLTVLMVAGVVATASALVLGTTGGEAALLVAIGTVAAREPRSERVVAAIGVTAAAAITITITLAPQDVLEQVARVVAALTTASAVGIAVRSRRAQLLALAARAAQLEREREQQAELAVSAERARIARELHDVVAHNVSVMVALAAGAQLTVESAPDRAMQAMAHVAATGREALTELRGLLGVLRDGGAIGNFSPQPGIVALDDLLERVHRAGLQARLHIGGEPVALGSGTQLTIYRIVQEALTNALRHGHGASGIDVHLRYYEDAVELEILNDGLLVPVPSGAGRGLVGMRERAAVHGVNLQAGPRRSGGWRVATQVPIGSVGGAG